MSCSVTSTHPASPRLPAPPHTQGLTWPVRSRSSRAAPRAWRRGPAGRTRRCGTTLRLAGRCTRATTSRAWGRLRRDLGYRAPAALQSAGSGQCGRTSAVSHATARGAPTARQPSHRPCPPRCAACPRPMTCTRSSTRRPRLRCACTALWTTACLAASRLAPAWASRSLASGAWGCTRGWREARGLLWCPARRGQHCRPCHTAQRSGRTPAGFSCRACMSVPPTLAMLTRRPTSRPRHPTHPTTHAYGDMRTNEALRSQLAHPAQLHVCA